MLIELDTRKAEAAILPLLDKPVGSVSIREKLQEFAATEHLQL